AAADLFRRGARWLGGSGGLSKRQVAAGSRGGASRRTDPVGQQCSAWRFESRQ
ncbi:unnamed protein product, partial [Effrenium voratum]